VNSDKQKRILIIRPDRIGDVVLSTPIPRELKQFYPDCYVGVLVRNYTKDIYINNPNVNQIIIDSEKKDIKSKIQLVREIRSHNFTHAFMLLPTERMNWLLFFAGIKNRIGVGHKFYQFITNTKSVYRRKYIPLRHEADYCMDMARKIGVDSNNLDTEIHLTEDERNFCLGLKQQFKRQKDYVIGIHVTSGNSVPNWKPNIYADLIRKLQSLPNVSVLITDLIIPDEVKNLKEVIYPPQKSLRDLVHIISCLDILIASSTGPTHITAALQIPTLTMFCPLPACSQELWSPKGNNAINILPDKNYCEVVCSGNPKQCSFKGEGGISVERVYYEVKEFFKQKNISI